MAVVERDVEMPEMTDTEARDSKMKIELPSRIISPLGILAQ